MAGGAFVLPKAHPSGPPYFSRNQVAQALHQVAVLLELNGANVFRVRSYQNASRMLGGLTQDLGELVASGELFELKGIGKGWALHCHKQLVKEDGQMIGLHYTETPLKG